MGAMWTRYEGTTPPEQTTNVRKTPPSKCRHLALRRGAYLDCQIVRDLVDAAIVTTRAKLRRQMRADIAAAVEERILDSLIGTDGPSTTRVGVSGSRWCGGHAHLARQRSGDGGVDMWELGRLLCW